MTCLPPIGGDVKTLREGISNTEIRLARGYIAASIEVISKIPPAAVIASSHKTILSEKIVQIDSTVKAILSIVGLEDTTQKPPPTATSSLAEYKGILEKIDQQLERLHASNKEKLPPAQLLGMNTKLKNIAQNLEFFKIDISRILY